MSRPPHFLSPLVSAPTEGLVLRNADTGRVLASRLEGAFDSKSRTRGLLGRTSLAPDAVMIIAPCNSVHTFFMKFAIDVVFTSRDGTILKIYRGLKPWRIAFAARAFATLEFAAGTAERSSAVVGNRLVIGAQSGTAQTHA